MASRPSPCQRPFCPGREPRLCCAKTGAASHRTVTKNRVDQIRTLLLSDNQDRERIRHLCAASATTAPFFCVSRRRWRTELGGDEIEPAGLRIQRKGARAGLRLKSLFENETCRAVLLHDCERAVAA